MISRFLPQQVRRFLGAKPQKHDARPVGYTLIDQPGQLEPLLRALDKADEVALDTEADNMFHYRVRVCLLQFLVGKEAWLVDSLGAVDLRPLWPRLAQKRLVMHGSDFDLRLLHDLCGFRASRLFDTMLAAQLLGRKRFGLAALLEEHFGVQLDKDGQKANWSKRPITPKLLDYAALDVWHLPALRDLLARELSKLGRLDWLEQQCQAQIEAGTQGFAPADENDWRIGHSEKLRGRSLALLHAVWHWREQQAERHDTPPFKICSNDLLLRLARAASEAPPAEEGANGEPVTVEAVLAGVHLGRRHERLLPSLTAAVNAGLARDPHTLPRRPGRDPRRLPLTQDEIALMEKIKEDRDRLAAKLGFEPTLIANRSQLSQIARAPAEVDALLLPWQAGLMRGLPSLKN